MNFSARVDELQQRVAATKAAVQAAATESRDQLRQRIDQAQQDAKDAQQRAEQRADQTADRARGKFAQMKADAAAKMDDIQAKIDKRAQQLDTNMAADEAAWAEADAADALDFADWAVDNAQLAMLDAIDARAYADKLAKGATT
jgi:DNA anti-recombination protein RmuC